MFMSCAGQRNADKSKINFCYVTVLAVGLPVCNIWRVQLSYWDQLIVL